MKAKQKTLRIFDIQIDHEAEFFTYLEKNLVLLKEYFLALSGEVTPAITDYLDELKICYIDANTCHLKISSKTPQEENRDTMAENRSSAPAEKAQNTINSQTIVTIESIQKRHTLLIEKPIRSGEEIVHEGDVTVFGRVNSGAKIIAEGNVEVYGLIDGLVQCGGDYMIVKEIGKGHIIFNGDILEKERFDGKLKKVTYSSDGAIIKDIF